MRGDFVRAFGALLLDTLTRWRVLQWLHGLGFGFALAQVNAGGAEWRPGGVRLYMLALFAGLLIAEVARRWRGAAVEALAHG